MKEDKSVKIETDIVIVGSGVAGLYCAINLPKERKITIITKDDIENSDSYLAQGGICVLKDDDDYDSFFEDTMRAGHYKNDRKSVDIMIRSSREIIDDLIDCGVRFERVNGKLAYTKEGAHSTARILFHEDVTGKEITNALLLKAKSLENVRIMDKCMMVDIICNSNQCYGVYARSANGEMYAIRAVCTVLASGGIGGLFENSTNFSHLTGDALAVAIKHGIALKDIDCIQIHPTTLYSKKPGRRFLISESVRGEGAILLNKNGERFVDELLPRDILSNAIFEQMIADETPYVWLSLAHIPADAIITRFPHIYEHCLMEGYDITKESIPVVPAQHYFMGGIKVDDMSRTSMSRLYAVGETSCNGVHGSNRLASNSLLESLVWSKRAATDISAQFEAFKETGAKNEMEFDCYDLGEFEDIALLEAKYKDIVLKEIERMKGSHE